MDRRSFVHALGGASMLAAMGPSAAAQTGGRRTRYYRLAFFYLRMGDQAARLNQFFTGQMPFLTRLTPGPVGVFQVFVGEHMPAMMYLSGYPNLGDLEAAIRKAQADSGYQKAVAELEQGAEQPYNRVDTVLLEATDYSPEIVPLKEKPKAPRIFELRVYQSPTLRQARLVHERFAGPEIKIFHRVGIHPILYSSTVVGPKMPNLTYLTPFSTLADREKAWEAFGADAEWAKVRKESIDRGGQIVSQIDITLLRPTDYSPLQ
jgi:hypothetical protein